MGSCSMSFDSYYCHLPMTATGAQSGHKYGTIAPSATKERRKPAEELLLSRSQSICISSHLSRQCKVHG